MDHQTEPFPECPTWSLCQPALIHCFSLSPSLSRCCPESSTFVLSLVPVTSLSPFLSSPFCLGPYSKWRSYLYPPLSLPSCFLPKPPPSQPKELLGHQLLQDTKHTSSSSWVVHQPQQEQRLPLPLLHFWGMVFCSPTCLTAISQAFQYAMFQNSSLQLPTFIFSLFIFPHDPMEPLYS